MLQSLVFLGAPAMVVLSFCPAGGHAFFVAVRAWFYSDLGGDVWGDRELGFRVWFFRVLLACKGCIWVPLVATPCCGSFGSDLGGDVWGDREFGFRVWFFRVLLV